MSLLFAGSSAGAGGGVTVSSTFIDSPPSYNGSYNAGPMTRSAVWNKNGFHLLTLDLGGTGTVYGRETDTRFFAPNIYTFTNTTASNFDYCLWYEINAITLYNTTQIVRVPLTSSYNLGTANWGSAYYLSVPCDAYVGFNADGTKLVAIGTSGGNTYREYSCSTPYQINTASLTRTLSIDTFVWDNDYTPNSGGLSYKFFWTDGEHFVYQNQSTYEIKVMYLNFDDPNPPTLTDFTTAYQLGALTGYNLGTTATAITVTQSSSLNQTAFAISTSSDIVHTWLMNGTLQTSVGSAGGGGGTSAIPFADGPSANISIGNFSYLYFENSSGMNETYNWLANNDYAPTAFLSYYGYTSSHGFNTAGWIDNNYGSMYNNGSTEITLQSPTIGSSPATNMPLTAPWSGIRYFLGNTTPDATSLGQFPVEMVQEPPAQLDIIITWNSYQNNNHDIAFRDELIARIIQAGNGVNLKIYGTDMMYDIVVNDVYNYMTNTFPTMISLFNYSINESRPIDLSAGEPVCMAIVY